MAWELTNLSQAQVFEPLGSCSPEIYGVFLGRRYMEDAILVNFIANYGK